MGAELATHPDAPAPRPRRRIRLAAPRTRWMRRLDSLAVGISLLAGLLIIVLLVGMVIEMVQVALPAIRVFGFRFFVSREWDPVQEQFGAMPFLYGTLVSSAVALLIAAPLGIGTALFLTEVAPRRLRGPIGFVVDMLAAIPSVVYGLWGIFVLAPFVANKLGPWLSDTLGFIPLFRGPSLGVSMLTAGLILSVMIVPYITAISREVLFTVPPDVKAASLALGATQWETIWKVVLPYARVGIGGGVVLALGRALGETMAVTMVIGNQPKINVSLLQPGYSMAAVIANEFTEAATPLYVSALVEVGLALFIVTFVINLGARWLLWRMRLVR
jgi:phosphate transport system permease protein